MEKNKSNYGGRQPRIGRAEQERGAQHPRPIKPEDAPKHPGYPGKP